MSILPTSTASAPRRLLPWALLLSLLVSFPELSVAQGSSLRLPALDGGGELQESRLTSGDATILIFWASWSPRCRDIVERSNAIADRWQDKARVVTVNFQEAPAEVRRFLRGQSARVPVYLDEEGRFAKKHSVTTLPSLLVYAGGELVYQGRLPADADRVIGEALGGS